ncbi:adenine deaminase [Carboxylicivirga mesophila]|uniref:Adenine deaminase n=1 Tax=Carboxylicivirga mesophila TaxID=1166478 RepID=A0ABS5KDF0_9BACT|nr:adenine deaminase [Carboxylicivirga mesophila]MBS2212528.1 adenine deaminase [Carboxylicivirga mesophila]
MKISGNIVDVVKNEIFPGDIEVENNTIISIRKNTNSYSNYILPGLVDSHVHIESSMLTPSRFAQLVVPRGTVGVVSDPHEIANVMGVKGVEYMIKDAKSVPLKCYFGVPSCVPATDFETSGHKITEKDVEYLLENGASFLAEMMNFPGVIHGDKEVWNKLELAKKYNVPIDGHAPGLRGEELEKYASGGITTDHECFSIDEALDKIKCGIKTQIREGSAARNFEALHPLITREPLNTMLCTDDSHPDLILAKGHIDRLVRLGLAKGYSIFEMYQVAVVNPVKHYNLPIGLLQEGDAADFIIVDNLSDFNVRTTYVDGKKVAEDGQALFELSSSDVINNFKCTPITLDDVKVVAPVDNPGLRLMEAEDGELLTEQTIWNTSYQKGEEIQSSLDDDILKIVVVNRYREAQPVVGFIKNFGLLKGALASSVAHDSHNIVAIGCDDESLVRAINAIIDTKGGIVATDGNEEKLLKLPVAGLMSVEKGEEVAKQYTAINRFVAKMGCDMKAPFMTLAFMSLLVIPSLKIGDKGLFDVNTFSFTSLFVDDK